MVDLAVQGRSFSDLSDDLLLFILSHLTPGQRGKAACTCQRWTKVVRILQTGLRLEGPADLAHQQQGRVGRALTAALAARSGRLSWLHCQSGSLADLEWLAFVAGLLAQSLSKLGLCSGAEAVGHCLQWLAGLPQLEVPKATLQCVPAALQDLSVFNPYTDPLVLLASASLATSLTRLVLRLGTPRTPEPSSQSLAGLTRLQKLHLHDLAMDRSLLAALPQSLCALALPNGYLHTGGLSGALQRLTGLTSLCLSAFVSTEEGDFMRLPLASLTALEVLRLDRCGLMELPEQLPAMKSLKVLNLQGNGLEQLPAEGAYLGCLQALDCRNNFLPTGVPPHLQLAPALQLLIWSEQERYLARRVPGPGLRLMPAVPTGRDLPASRREQYFELSVRSHPRLVQLWHLLQGDASL